MTETDARELTTIVLVILGALLLWPLLMMGFGGMMYGMWGSGGMMSGPYGGGGGMGTYGLVGIGIQLLFLVVLLGGGYLLVRRVLAQRDADDPALAELRRTYARGELSDEEYETRRAKLQSDE